MANNNQKVGEKIIRIKLGKPSILTILVSISLILTLINLYWTANLANQLASLTGGGAGGAAGGALREVQPQQPPQQQEQQRPRITEVGLGSYPVLGSVDAPVTVVEFSCFECPFCASFNQETLPLIKENYVKTGKVKLVFRDFPLPFHPNAQKAHEAARCANEQGNFWEYHASLFKNYQSLSVENLKNYARDLGLNTAKFNECLDSGRMETEVSNDLKDGSNYGVNGTPTFFINGIELVGAQPYSAFEQLIEQELNK